MYLDVALWALDYDEATVAPRFVREQPELAMNFFSHAVLQLKGFAELINKAVCPIFPIFPFSFRDSRIRLILLHLFHLPH